MSMQSLDRRVGLALGVATLGSMALLALGVTAMVLTGVQPLARPYAGFDPGRLMADVSALRLEGLLWLGLIAVMLTPAVRVGASLVGFAAAGDRRQAAIALTVLAIMLLSVALGYGG